VVTVVRSAPLAGSTSRTSASAIGLPAGVGHLSGQRAERDALAAARRRRGTRRGVRPGDEERIEWKGTRVTEDPWWSVEVLEVAPRAPGDA
jgi:hypothetical protein